ncbi:hypothetical protein JCM21714_4104 [Gracilibacillus boraciitolerans JCM 21714]|uniref:Lipoprotein n=1 Tax=Gracilibacillus boraciitolerans JCM 21714 TaxID=1298598 RepID=W4VNC7_9BACI|nr:hypothetical protein [Gracilibacillus boraciitolerans]GAE94905.1 hypothetical protein JCM21714_4104 [Gracilibacillus boraciitolerans JCM 21714]
MKKFHFGSLIVLILLTLLGCQQNAVLSDELNLNKDIEGFVEPESSDWVKYTNAVREYMYYRTQAMINKDIHILWERYPKLKENIDLEQGINVEKSEVESLNQGFDLLDANYNIESYDQIKANAINDNEVIVLVHGNIAYLRNDFDESGGEYLMKVFLKKEDNQWTVIKTDEYTLPEYKELFQE